jgi:hypothetical protein
MEISQFVSLQFVSLQMSRVGGFTCTSYWKAVQLN